jgi:hypothetical protein
MPLITALCLVFVLGQVTPLAAQSAPPSDDTGQGPTRPCRVDPAACGMPIRVSDDLGGLNNCWETNCLTHRIVNLADLATDFLPVPLSVGFTPTPDGVDEDGVPWCTPQPAGRVPAAWGQVPVAAYGQVRMNPDPQGLTGLESWFWYEGATEVEWISPVYAGVRADCSVIPAPAPVTYRAAITRIDWEIGDSRPVRVSSTGTGSEAEPAVRHTYRTKGEWGVSARCVWEGAPGAPLVWDCAQREVPVIEVRSVRTR